MTRSHIKKPSTPLTRIGRVIRHSRTRAQAAAWRGNATFSDNQKSEVDKKCLQSLELRMIIALLPAAGFNL